jgi:ketosteroid isomerase-like protein
VSHAIASTMYDAFNRRDFAAALAVIAPDSQWTVVASGQTGVGHDAFLGWARMITTKFPDVRIEVKRFVEQGDTCVTEFVAKGTGIEQRTCELLDFHDGKIARATIYF